MMTIQTAKAIVAQAFSNYRAANAIVNGKDAAWPAPFEARDTLKQSRIQTRRAIKFIKLVRAGMTETDAHAAAY